MADEKSKNTGIFAKLPARLAILIGSGLAILNGAPRLDAKIALTEVPGVKTEFPSASVRRPLPPKLILKHVGNGYKMIAQHDSHSSHSSHSSHASHSSHSSHVSGGFV
jgi:hypothetical protein